MWGKPQDQVSIPLSQGKRGLRVSEPFLYTSDDKRSEDFRPQKFGKNQVNARDFPGRYNQVRTGPKGAARLSQTQKRQEYRSNIKCICSEDEIP